MSIKRYYRVMFYVGWIILILFLTLMVTSAAQAETKTNKITRFSLSITTVGLGIADVATTIYGTKRGLVETNGLFKHIVMDKHYFALWTVEFIGTAVVVIACNILTTNRSTWLVGYVVFATVIIFRSITVMHNAKLNGRIK